MTRPNLSSWLGAALLLATALMLATACQPCTGNEARQLPKLAPPPYPALPSGLHVEVVVDGKPSPSIDAAKLQKTPPDFQQFDRRIWRLSSLLGSVAAQPGATLEITGDQGVQVIMRQPADSQEPQPMLVVSRRGEVLVAMVSPTQPFPLYHRQGRRLARSGDPLPRVLNVRKVSIRTVTSGH